MNEIEKIDYIHNVIKETLWAIENDISNAPIGMLENSLELLEDLRAPYLTAIKEKINSGQF
jgi:hypothetical protein|tara:strand:- start:2307 stop:2489 length:183 start_codon:yes stop_codon:yes gene_type:complete